MSERQPERGRATSARAGGQGGQGGTRSGGQGARRRRPAEAEAVPSPRTGAKRTVMAMLGQLPAYLKLLAGLLRDSRVNRMDKILVGAAIAYILMPLDWVPDFIPFLGQVDDVFLLATSLRRLIKNAGRTVLHDHWSGSLTDLSEMNLERVIASAAFFLPRGIRRRLRVLGRAS